MKAVVYVSSQSVFSELNRRTFEVVEILNNGNVCLLVKDRRIDFSAREVFIVDIDKEMNKSEDRFKNIDFYARRVSVSTTEIKL